MKFTRYLITMLIVLVGVGSAGAQEVRGYVQEVDATKGTISLIMFSRGKVSGVKSFNLSKPDIPVVNPAGQAMKLSDVQPEAPVTLKLNAQEDVVSIITPLPIVHGPLTDIDPKKGELVSKLLPGRRTIALAPETKIYLHGEPAKLKDLTVGTYARVIYTQDEKSVVEVRAGKGINYPQPMMRKGVLIEMDTDKRLARVFATSAMGDANMLRELPLAKDATFSLNYQGQPICALKMEEITKGFTTTYWVEPIYHKVVHINVEMPVLVRRTVKALDQDKRTLTILEDEVERVLTLSPRVKVLGVRGAGKLEDIVPGAIVDCGLNPDRKQIEVLIVPSK